MLSLYIVFSKAHLYSNLDSNFALFNYLQLRFISTELKIIGDSLQVQNLLDSCLWKYLQPDFIIQYKYIFCRFKTLGSDLSIDFYCVAYIYTILHDCIVWVLCRKWLGNNKTTQNSSASLVIWDNDMFLTIHLIACRVEQSQPSLMLF